MNSQNPDRINRQLFGLRTDQLYLVIVLAGFCFFVSLVPMPPNDFWWHLKIGELIYTTGEVPSTNIFAWTLPASNPFYYAAWLGELIFFLLHKIGSLELVIFSRNLLAGLSLFLVGLEARRRSDSWRIAALVTAIACLMITNNLPVRTQQWAWLPFIAFFSLLSRYSEKALPSRTLLLCPFLMVFWVNVHGSYVLGLLIIALFVLGESIRKVLRLDDPLSWKDIRWLILVGIATGLAILVNPRFFGIFGYVSNLLSDKSIQAFIEEWQSPTPQGIANTVFFASILLLIAALAYTRYRLKPTELLIIAVFLWLAWGGQRSVVWYGMAVMPILARLISHLPIPLPKFQPARNWVNVGIAFLLFVPVFLVQPWFVEKFPLPETYWDQVHRNSPAGPLISIATPIDAAEYLESKSGGNLFNELGQGSYLIWAVPDQGVFIDPRIELYPYEQWEDYIHISQGTQYNSILERYQADRILLDIELQDHLASTLGDDPTWSLEYEDERAQIWMKKH